MDFSLKNYPACFKFCASVYSDTELPQLVSKVHWLNIIRDNGGLKGSGTRWRGFLEKGYF